MATDTKGNTEGTKQEYQGAGRFVAANGRGGLWAVAVGGIGSALVGIFGKKSLAAAAESGELTKGLKGSIWAVGIAAVIAGIYGAVTGWMSASKGKQQFEDAQAQLGEAKTMIGAQQQEIMAAHQEIATSRKAFTETIKPRADLAEIKPRAEHGSHVAAHEADKAHAATAEAVRA